MPPGATVDLMDLSAFAEGRDHEIFHVLRDHDPLRWNDEPDRTRTAHQRAAGTRAAAGRLLSRHQAPSRPAGERPWLSTAAGTTSGWAGRLARSTASGRPLPGRPHRRWHPAPKPRSARSPRGEEPIDAWPARHPRSGPAACDTSKAALAMWTQCLAARLPPRRVRAVNVSPGPVQTPIPTTSAPPWAPTASTARSPCSAGTAPPTRPDASWRNGIDVPVEDGLHAARRHRP